MKSNRVVNLSVLLLLMSVFGMISTSVTSSYNFVPFLYAGTEEEVATVKVGARRTSEGALMKAVQKNQEIQEKNRQILVTQAIEILVYNQEKIQQQVTHQQYPCHQ